MDLKIVHKRDNDTWNDSPRDYEFKQYSNFYDSDHRLNHTFEIVAVYGSTACVIDHKGKYYEIVPSQGNYAVNLVVQPRTDWERQEYHFVKIRQLTETRNFTDALYFIEDDFREFLDKRIEVIVEQINRFSHSSKIPVTVDVEHSKGGSTLLHTNLQSIDLKDDNMTFGLADIEIQQIKVSPEGLTLLVETYELFKKLEKQLIYPERTMRTSGQCDVAKCNNGSMRGKYLCHEHLIDYENGISLPEYYRGEEGEDLIQYSSKNVNCGLCEKSIDWRIKANWIPESKLAVEELDKMTGCGSYDEERKTHALCPKCQSGLNYQKPKQEA